MPLRTLLGALCAAALSGLAAAQPPSTAPVEELPLSPETVQSSQLGPVKVLALRFSDTVDHGRSVRPIKPGDSWAPNESAAFTATFEGWGMRVDGLDVPDVPPAAEAAADEKDGTPYDVERDRSHFLAERPRPRPGKKTPQKFDAYLLGDFAHRQKIGLWFTSRYWVRFTLLNRKGEVVFSKVYERELSTLAININRVNREARILEREIPAEVLSDMAPLLNPESRR